jgi:hypothetical protein
VADVALLRRLPGITALGVFFSAGALIAATSAFSLLTPGGPLEPIWRLNPRARIAFDRVGPWAVPLMVVVSLACASAAVGLFRCRRWGHRLAIGILSVNLVGDVLNTILGTEPRAVIGVPIAAALIAYLWTARIRRFFGRPFEMSDLK